MLTQEAAYKQIQDAKTMVEDDLQRKLDEFEEEQERLTKLANTAGSLERELEQVFLLKTPEKYLFSSDNFHGHTSMLGSKELFLLH